MDGVTASEPPLRIAYLLQQFPLPSETFAVSDISALLALGHSVCVFTLKRPRANEQQLLEDSGVPQELSISRTSLSRVREWPRLLWRYRSAAAMLLARIARGAPAHPVTAFQALLCIPRLLEIAHEIERLDCNVVHAFWARHVGLVLPVLHARDAVSLRSAFVGAYDLVADDFLVEATLSAAELVFSHAEVNRPYVERRSGPGAKIEIVRRGIPLPPLSNDTVRDHFSWVTASSLIRPKNVEAVLRAFAFARAREPRLTLAIFGEGPDRSRLEAIALDLGCTQSVSFKGHVRREALFAEMERASVFLLLSKGKWERLPNVLKEALWAGCAVISSNTPGIEELIPDASIGHVVDPDDREAVALAVSEVLDRSDAEQDANRRRARAHISEHFSSESSMRRYAEAWKIQLLAGSGREVKSSLRATGEAPIAVT
jgi:glycosyltransferase involved in cell wall biosynthesis